MTRREPIRNEEAVIGKRITSITRYSDSIEIKVGDTFIWVTGTAYDEDDNSWNAEMEIEIQVGRPSGGLEFNEWITDKQWRKA